MSGFGYRITRGEAERVSVKDALTCHADLVWVHLSTTEEVAQEWLREQAQLNDYVVDALTATETRPRCEQFGHGALLNLRGRSTETPTSGDPLASVRVWAIKGRVFSVTRKPLYAIDQVVKKVEAGEVSDPGDLISAIATAITEDLDPVVADLGDELDACEEKLDPSAIFELRRTVMRVRIGAIGYRRFLVPQRTALEKLAQLPGDWLAEDDRLHLAAAADRAARMAEELESIRERAALLHETLTDLRAEQIDHRSLVISIVAVVFLPLTFITGLYGMNVDGLPFQHASHAFDWITIGCVVLGVGILGYFLRRHWFRH